MDDKTQESTERWAMKWRKVLLLTWYRLTLNASTRKILQRPPTFPHLRWVKPCNLCDFLRAELASARVEATALHRDRAARVGDAPAGSRERAALFQSAMLRWQIAASNLEFHYAELWEYVPQRGVTTHVRHRPAGPL